MNIGEIIDDLIDDPQTTDDRQLVCFSATNFERVSACGLSPRFTTEVELETCYPVGRAP